MSKQQKHFHFQLARWNPSTDWFHDPMLENPLDAEFEGLITMVGERRYLQEIVKRFGLQFNRSTDELTDHECRKVIRAIMRHAEDYSGPEMKQ